jgi:hypothetical protein
MEDHSTMPSTLKGTTLLGLLPAVVSAFAATAAHAQATTPPANPVTAAPTATPAAATPTPAPPPAITFSALLDGYYSYNFNKPRTATGGPTVNGPGAVGFGRNFDSADNSMSLGLAEIGVTKAVNDASRLGFTVKLAYGPTVTELTSPGDASNTNILQAYGTFLVPVGGKDLTVDAGKFVTHMGYEVIEPGLNYNYSRADLFQYFIPYYHSGVRASYPFSSTVTGTGYVYNGWNNVAADNNVGKAYGFNVTVTPSSKCSFILNGITSAEPVNGVSRAKNVIEPIATYNFTTALSGVVDANFDFGKGLSADPTSTNDSSWNAFGVAGYLRYAMPSGSAFTVRGEYFKDDKGFLTGANKQKGSEITATYGIKSPLFPGAETRFEFRHDKLDQPGLLPDTIGGFSKTTQNTLSISEVLAF